MDAATDHPGRRAHLLSTQLRKHIARHHRLGDELVAIFLEDTMGKMNFSSIRSAHTIRTVVELVAYPLHYKGRRVQVCMVNTQHAKRALTGNPRADHDEVIAAAAPHLDLPAQVYHRGKETSRSKTSRSDIAHAYAIGLGGFEVYEISMLLLGLVQLTPQHQARADERAAKKKAKRKRKKAGNLAPKKRAKKARKAEEC